MELFSRLNSTCSNGPIYMWVSIHVLAAAVSDIDDESTTFVCVEARRWMENFSRLEKVEEKG